MPIPSHDKIASAVVLNDTSGNNHYGSRLVMQQIHACCDHVGLCIIHSVPRGDDWRAPKHIEHVERADCVIVNGEGSIHSSRRNVRALLSVADHCQQRSIKCFLINSVYQNNSEEIAELVRCFDRVFVRESRSQSALMAQGITAQLVPDMSLSYSNEKLNGATRRHGILFSDSVEQQTSTRLLDLFRQIDRAEPVSLAVKSPTGLSAFEDWALANAVKLLRGLAPKSWHKEARKVAKRSARPFGYRIERNLDELLCKIAASQLVITGRFHMVCLALLTRTPFIALPSNTYKIEGLLEDIGLPKRLAAGATSPATVGEFCGWREHELEKVETYLAHARRSIKAMFNSIRADLS